MYNSINTSKEANCTKQLKHKAYKEICIFEDDIRGRSGLIASE